MAVTFDIHNTLTKIDNNSVPVRSSLSCGYSSSASPPTGSITYTRIGEIVTPTELLYALYSIIDKNLKFGTDFTDTIDYSYPTPNINYYYLCPKFSPTCPYTVVEIETWSGTDNIERVSSNVRDFFELLLKTGVYMPTNNSNATPCTAIVPGKLKDGIFKEIVSCINTYVKYEYLTNIICTNTIMRPFILLLELDAFVEFLSDVCKYSVNTVFMRNVVTSEINGNMHIPSTSPCAYDPQAYKILVIMQQEKVMSTVLNVAKSTGDTILYSNKEIDFGKIVRFSSLPDNSDKMLVDDGIITNGKFEFTTQFNKIENFNKEFIKEKYRSIADLEAGKIASRNKVLQAIYEIFYYWLNNANIINIDINVCHNNCHTNTFKVKVFSNRRTTGRIVTENPITQTKIMPDNYSVKYIDYPPT